MASLHQEQINISLAIEVVSVMFEYPQDGGSVCCCYDYCIGVQVQNFVVRCTLRVMSDACHAEREHPQDGGHRKKTDSLY